MLTKCYKISSHNLFVVLLIQVIKILSNIKTGEYAIEGDNYYNKNILAKSEILFAFSKENMYALKPHVIMRKSVKNQHLLLVVIFNNRFQVSDIFLMQDKWFTR